MAISTQSARAEDLARVDNEGLLSLKNSAEAYEKIVRIAAGMSGDKDNPTRHAKYAQDLAEVRGRMAEIDAEILSRSEKVMERAPDWATLEDQREDQRSQTVRAAETRAGNYTGRIVGDSDTHVTQQVTASYVVTHPKDCLDRVPAPGESVRINYAASHAKVIPYQERDRARELEHAR